MILLLAACIELDPPCEGDIGDAFVDADGDGYGVGVPARVCLGRPGWATVAGDCDDDDPDTLPGGSEVPYDGADQDCDGLDLCDADLDGSDDISCGGTDCDDADADVGPTATEQWYDGIDADCGGDGDYDQDHDGVDSDRYGGEDCDDEDVSIYPEAEDPPYDGVDADCDGVHDYDLDGDGYTPDEYADESGLPGGDCDDENPVVNAQAQEVCDFADNNCDDAVDEGFDVDGDGVSTCSGDCDDDNAAVQPGAADEPYDGIDADCSGGSDYDFDGDGWVPSGYADDAGLPEGDCDDADASAYPAAADDWYDGVDSNCDGASDYDQDADGHESDVWGVGSADDCDDTDASVNPAASEVAYDGIDQDCRAGDLTDVDGDGYEAEAVGGTDCDDTEGATNPGATETVNNGDDEDCDGVDSCYTDDDGDTFGSTTTMDSDDLDCSDAGEADDATDCDDADAETFVGAASLELTTACTNDDDADGYGDETPSALYVAGTDCDDASSDDYPAATESVNNGDDEDCDGVDACYTDNDGDSYGSTTQKDSNDLDCADSGEADDATDCDDTDLNTFVGSASAELTTSCTNDDDNDGYGDATPSSTYVEGSDCDDTDDTVSPGDADVWYDGVDSDCDAASDYDQDADGYESDEYSLGSADDCDDTDASFNPGAADVLDGADQDCSGTDDDPAAEDVAIYAIYGDANDKAGSGGVAFADDIDGDGEDELVLSSGSVSTDAGEVWIFGASDLSAVTTVGDAWLTLTGGTGDQVGARFVVGLDWNADGETEVAAGAPGESVVYVIEPGSTSGTRGASAAAWATLSGTAGTGFGEAVAFGDLDGDGLDDLVAGAPSAASGKGTVYVFFGDTGAASKAASAADYSVPGADSGDGIGSVLSSGADPTGDGIDDLAVGLPGDDENARTNSGSVFLISGSALLTNPLALSLESQASWTLTGSAASQAVGTDIAFGDVASTANTDILVGATGYSWTGGLGAVGVFYGPSSGTESFTAADRLVRASGGGSAVSGGEDLDGDGSADFLLGAETASLVWLVGLTGSTGTLSLPGSQMASWSGGSDELGGRVEGAARDLDADGVLDVAAAAPSGDGVVYLLHVYP